MRTRITIGRAVAAGAALAAAALGAAAAGSAAAEAPAGAVVHARTVVDARGGETSELFVVGPGEDRRLTRNAVADHSPSWSPDRRRVVFVRTGSGGSDLWVVRRDGSGARRLVGSSRAYDADPAWSPDGRLIAFTSTRAWPGGDGGGELYVMRADGTGVRRLTRTHRWRNDIQPRFSPDGRHLVYASGHGSSFELFRIRVADGRGVKRLTSRVGSGDGDDLMPDWSPDGRRIAFVSSRAGAWQVQTIPADGGPRRTHAGGPGAWVAYPRWDGTGTQLLYGSTREGGGVSTLKAVDVRGGAPVDVLEGFDGDW